MELPIEGETYRIGKLDAFKQFHITRRLAPILFALGQGMSSLAPEKQVTEGAEQVVQAGAEEAIFKAFRPIADVLAKMSDEDTEYVLAQCLNVCSKQQGSGWAPVRVAGRLMFEDMSMQVMMRLTVATIQENLGNFFRDPSAK